MNDKKDNGDLGRWNSGERSSVDVKKDVRGRLLPTLDKSLSKEMLDVLVELSKLADGVKSKEEEYNDMVKVFDTRLKEFIAKNSRSGPFISSVGLFGDGSVPVMTSSELYECIKGFNKNLGGDYLQKDAKTILNRLNCGVHEDLYGKLEEYTSNLDSLFSGGPTNLDLFGDYRIGPFLHKCLMEGRDPFNRDTNEVYKKGVFSDTSSKTGFYLVILNRVAKGGKIVPIYQYMKFNYMFLNTFLSYIYTQQNAIPSQGLVGETYFFCVDNILTEECFSGEELPWIRGRLHDISSVGSSFMHVINVLKLVVGGGLIKFSLNDLARLVHLMVVQKVNGEGLLKFLSDCSSSKIVSRDFVGNFNPSFNILNRFVFVVSDLDVFVEKVNKELGFPYKINSGNQRFRGRLNSTMHKVYKFEDDFRLSLLKHNRFYADKGLCSRIPLKNFNFNMHINFGTVKWFSTISPKKINRNFTGRLFMNDCLYKMDCRFILTSYNNINKLYSTKVDLKNRLSLFKGNYNYIEDLLKEKSNKNYVNLQMEIEKLLHEQEKVFHENNLGKLKTVCNFGEGAYEFIVQSKKDLVSLINNIDCDKYPYFVNKHCINYNPVVRVIVKELGSEDIACILLSYLFKIWSTLAVVDDNSTKKSYTNKSVGFTQIGADLGKNIWNKFICKKLNNYNKSNSDKLTYNQYYEKYIDTNSLYQIVGEDCYRLLGGILINNLCIIDLAERVPRPFVGLDDKGGTFLELTSSCKKILGTKNMVTYYLPQKLPMVSPPKNWEDNKFGGFLLNDVSYCMPLIREKYNMDVQTKIIKNNNMILSMVNKIQSVPYKINKDTLKFINKFGNIKKILELFDDNLKKVIEEDKGSINKEDMSRLSKLSVQDNTIRIAEIYSEMDKIYFAVKLDFRLRLYCDANYFGYQHTDLARGLISFANPGKLLRTDEEGIKFFKAFGANMYGNGWDKKSLNSKVEWIDSNKDLLLDFESNDIVDKAESKTSFVSFCFEYKKFVNWLSNPDNYVFDTYLPIQLDATCNGYQHLALLTGEFELFDQLNLDKSSYNSKPNDFYSHVKSRYEVILREDLETLNSRSLCNLKDKEKLAILRKLSEVDLGRDLFKKVVMVDGYSASVTSIVGYLLGHESIKEFKCESGDNKDKALYRYKSSTVSLSRDDIWYFVVYIKKAIDSITPNIKNLITYLNGIVYICTALNLPVPWSLPTGAVIKQSYMQSKDEQIAAFSFTKTKFTFKKFFKGRYNFIDQKKAIRPNLIHSLDASVIAYLIARINAEKEDNFSIYTVHDCFAVTADKIPYLMKSIKLIYISMYLETHYLLEFDNFVKTVIKNVYGKDIFTEDDKFIYLPKKGKEEEVLEYPDIKKVLEDEGLKKFLKLYAYPDIKKIRDGGKLSFDKSRILDSKYLLI